MPVAVNMIVGWTIMFNFRFRIIKGIRRRIGLDRIQVPIELKVASCLLPSLLELVANLIIAGLFKWWPGYLNTLSIGDMLTIGFLRPRFEWFVITFNYLRRSLILNPAAEPIQ